jgi:ferredoxin
VLWGRGIYPSWNLFILGPSQPVGKVYEFAKDLVAILVVVGVSVFFYFRVVRPQKRMTLNKEAILILVIIFTMMITDMMYDGASMVLAYRQAELCAPDSVLATVAQCKTIATITAPYPMGTEAHASFSFFPSPAGSAFATAFKGLPAGALILLAQIGFWTHSSLVLIFLNLLPHSKHFHVITAIPNVFLKSMDPAGRLKPMAESTEKLMEKLEAAAGMDDPLAGEIGVARIDQFSWKAVLDFYTCTECGRCSDNCPAHRTGKVLSPKHLTLALRDHLYDNEAMWATWCPTSSTRTSSGPAPAAAPAKSSARS